MAHDAFCQRLQRAVGILVSEKDRVKERLLVAYASQLSNVDPARDVPEALLGEFDEIRYALSDAGMPYGYGEHAARKLNNMTEDEASQLARRIFALSLRALERVSASV